MTSDQRRPATGWHADDRLLTRYAAGDTDHALAASVEAHLLACSRCRAAIATFVESERLDAGWEALIAVVDAPARGPVESLLVRLGVADHTARLLAATPSLRLSWLAAVTVALAFSVLAARVSGDSPLLFLVIAPLLPLGGVAAAYGPGVDPTYEIGLASPLPSGRLLLLRAAAVLTVSALLTTTAGLALPGEAWAAAAWLLPSLGLTLCSLALATAVAPLRAAVGVAVGWVALVTVATQAAADTLVAFRSTGQLIAAVVTVLAAAVLTRRREGLDIRRTA